MHAAPSVQFIDSHCHFDFPDFDADRNTEWERARQVGVTALIVPGISTQQWSRAEKLSRQYGHIYHGVGIHPWWLSELHEQEAKDLPAMIEAHLQESTCVAVGECGLDKVTGPSLEQQLSIFIAQLEVAKALSRPLIIHSVKAHNEVIAVLKKIKPQAGGVIHGFSGSVELAQRYWSLGFYLGIGGVITYERARKTRTMVQQLPLEALLLETDAPDMPLAGAQGQRNTPRKIPEVARQLAELRATTVEIIARQTTANAQQLFNFD